MVQSRIATIIVVRSIAGCAGNTVAFGSAIIARTVAITVIVIAIVIVEVMHGSLGAALCGSGTNFYLLVHQ